MDVILQKFMEPVRWVGYFCEDANISDIPGDILMNMEKAIMQLTTKN